MILSDKQTLFSTKRFTLLATALILPVLLHAAAPDTATVNKIIAQYRNYNAVYLNVTRHLVIESDNGKLVAHTDETLQKVMITDIAPNIYGREDLTYSFLNDLDNMPSGAAYIPSKWGYDRVRCSNYGGFHPADEGVFYDDNKGIAVLYSGLTKKSVTETRYTLNCAEVCMLPRLFFYQANLPITTCTIEVSAPSFVDMGFALKGENTSHIKQTKDTKNNITTYRFTYNNVPSLKGLQGVPSSLFFVPHVVPYIKSYTQPGEYKKTNMLHGTQGLYSYLYKFIKNINVADDKELSKTVEKITKDDGTPKQKAAHIYDWVQKNLHYVAFEDSMGGFYPRQASLINQRKFGDCKDMTSILVTMFRKAGINAYYTWIGTRHLPYTTEETPVPLFDHMICTIKINDEWIFVDGTNPVIPFGKWPDMDQGKEVVIALDRDNFKVMKLPVANPIENTTNDSTVIKVISGKSISGSIQLKYTGSMANKLADIMLLTKDEQRDRVMRILTGRGSNKYLISKYNVKTTPTGDRDCTVDAEYNIHDYIQKVKGQYIINMNMKRYLTDTWIDTTGRTVPYYFNNTEKIKETVVLELPKGSGAAHVPSPVRGSINNIINYSITYKVSGRKVILVKEYELKSLSIGKKEFAAYNKFVDKLSKAYKESVVLTGK